MKGWVLICLVLVWVVLLLHPLLPFLGQVLLVVGLIVAFITPMVFISDPSARASPDAAYHFGVIGEYQLAGVVLGVFVAAGYVVCLKWGVRERGEFGRDSLMVPTSWEALRRTLGNRAFMIFLVANTANWYVFGLLPTIIPIYGQFVLNIPLGQSLLWGCFWVLAFISAAVFVNVWKFVGRRLQDWRKAWIISMAAWIGALPLLFVSDLVLAMVVFFLAGIGLAGSL